MRCRSGSPVSETVSTVPPSGATESAPALGAGIRAMPQRSDFLVLRVSTCHGPLIIMAALPAMNWSLTSACVQLTVDLDSEPSASRAFQ
ncbi:hypothetical protein SGLAM104S_01191 [Streptomyces glaucescens]